MNGQIIAISCGLYSVKCDETVYQVKPRGTLKSKVGRLIVGDYVEIDEKNLTIDELLPRKSKLIRPAISNVDQIVIVLSYTKPEFSYELAFKYLTYSNLNDLPAILLVTKIDLCEDKKQLEEIKNVFEALNIQTVFVNNKDKDSVAKVKSIFDNKISCLMGQSGVGKSSLLNAIDSAYLREVGEFSKALGRGKHQTKEVILLKFGNGYIADTPGFSSLDLGLYKEDLAQFFPGFNNYINCFYTNCLHITENKCVIKEMVYNGKYPKRAYDTYIKLSNEALAKNRRFY